MYTYVAYGLSIHSAIPLPELVAGEEGGADIIIKKGEIDWRPPKMTYAGSCRHLTSEESHFFWERVGTFLVRDGREIIVEPFPGVEERLIRLPLLGPVLAGLLQQRQRLVLHASAVARHGRVIAFLGKKGWGKSTTAAALCVRGYSVLTDDVLAIDLNGPENATVHPGFPQLRLWPDAVACLGYDPKTLDRLYPEVEKRVWRTIDDFAQTPLSLMRIYVLDVGPELRIEYVPAQEAFIEIVRHSYFALSSQAEDIASAHFHYCVNLAKNVPIYRLKRPSSLSLLPHIAKLVERHVNNETGTHNMSFLL